MKKGNALKSRDISLKVIVDKWKRTYWIKYAMAVSTLDNWSGEYIIQEWILGQELKVHVLHILT